MDKQNWFASWFNSPYYKILYQNRDITEASHFTESLIHFLGLKHGDKLLDVACGEGRFSLQFAQSGLDVIGIDLAENSIEKALESKLENLNFYVHDMRKLFYVNYFDITVNLFTSFGYFSNKRDNYLAAKAMVDSLKDDGILVIDYFNLHWVLHNLKITEQVQRSDILFKIKKTFDGCFIEKTIEFNDNEGVNHHFIERVSALQQSDFTKLFEPLGLKLQNVFGSYNLDPFDLDNSHRLILIFKKNVNK